MDRQLFKTAILRLLKSMYFLVMLRQYAECWYNSKDKMSQNKCLRDCKINVYHISDGIKNKQSLQIKQYITSSCGLKQ